MWHSPYTKKLMIGKNSYCDSYGGGCIFFTIWLFYKRLCICKSKQTLNSVHLGPDTGERSGYIHFVCKFNLAQKHARIWPVPILPVNSNSKKCCSHKIRNNSSGSQFCFWIEHDLLRGQGLFNKLCRVISCQNLLYNFHHQEVLLVRCRNNSTVHLTPVQQNSGARLKWQLFKIKD